MVARVVVVGSINVDLVVAVERLPAAGETVAGGRFAQHGGGKSANQAVAAARLGAAVAFVGAVGDDAMGDEAVARARGRGHRRLRRRAARRADRRRADRGRRRGREPDRGRVRRQRRVRSDLRARPGRGDGVVLLGHEVSAGRGRRPRRARRTRPAGRVVLNPAPARELPDAALAVLTPNASEAAQLTGEDDPEAAARALVAERARPC